MEDLRRKIRLKCRYEGELRYVNLLPDLTFAQLKKRLATDYGFEVTLKYEDRDGDLITLSSQNDLDDLIAYTCESEHDTVNVIVSEAIQLPTLRRETPKNPNLFPITTTASISRQSVGKPFRMDYAGAPTGTSSGNRFDRFPQIDSPMGALAANYTPRDAVNRIRWKRGEVLGQGAFGVVFLGLNVDTGELMAVKQMAIDEVSSKELSSLENEINLLRSLRHPNIVRYIGTEVTAIALSIFLEYVPGGSLKTLIDKFGQLEETVARSYTRQLLLGLEYLHRNGIAHRDIKGANCLVGNDGVVKLADFGNSKQWRSTGPPDGSSQRSGDIKGTPSWMAPEVVRDQGLNISWKKADVWSLACTTLEMCTGKPPWSQFNNSVTTLYHIACQETLPEYPTDASIELISYLNVCLVRDPVHRPDVTSLLLHPFVMNAGIGMWDSVGGMGGMSGGMVRPSTVSSSVRGEWDPAGSWRTESRLGGSSTAASIQASSAAMAVVAAFPGSPQQLTVGGAGVGSAAGVASSSSIGDVPGVASSSIGDVPGGGIAFSPSMVGKSLEMQRMEISPGDALRSAQSTPRIYGRAETAAATTGTSTATSSTTAIGRGVLDRFAHATIANAPYEAGKVLLDVSALATDDSYSNASTSTMMNDHAIAGGAPKVSAAEEDDTTKQQPRKKKPSRFFSTDAAQEVDEYGRRIIESSRSSGGDGGSSSSSLMQSAIDVPGAIVGAVTDSMRSSPTQEGFLPYHPPRTTIIHEDHIDSARCGFPSSLVDDHYDASHGSGGLSGGVYGYHSPSSATSVAEEETGTIASFYSLPGSVVSGTAVLSDADFDSDSAMSYGMRERDRDRDQHSVHNDHIVDRDSPEEFLASQPKQQQLGGVRRAEGQGQGQEANAAGRRGSPQHAKAIPGTLPNSSSKISSSSSPAASSTGAVAVGKDRLSVSTTTSSGYVSGGGASSSSSTKARSPMKQGKLSSLTPTSKSQQQLKGGGLEEKEREAGLMSVPMSRHGSLEGMELAPISELPSSEQQRNSNYKQQRSSQQALPASGAAGGGAGAATGGKLAVTGTSAATPANSGAAIATTTTKGKIRSSSKTVSPAAASATQSKIPQISGGSGSGKSSSGKRSSGGGEHDAGRVGSMIIVPDIAAASAPAGSSNVSVSFSEGDPADYYGDKILSIGGIVGGGGGASDVSSINRGYGEGEGYGGGEANGYEIADEVSVTSSIAEDDEYFRPANSHGGIVSWSRLHVVDSAINDAAAEVDDDVDDIYKDRSPYTTTNAAEVDSDPDTDTDTDKKFGGGGGRGGGGGGGGRIAHTAAALLARASPTEFSPGTALTKARPSTIAPLNAPQFSLMANGSGSSSSNGGGVILASPKPKRSSARAEASVGWGSKQSQRSSNTSIGAGGPGGGQGPGMGIGIEGVVSWVDQREGERERGLLGPLPVSPGPIGVGLRFAEDKSTSASTSSRVSRVPSQREKAAGASSSGASSSAVSGGAGGGGGGLARGSLQRVNNRKSSNPSVQLEFSFDGGGNLSPSGSGVDIPSINASVMKISSPSRRRDQDGRRSRLTADESISNSDIRTTTAAANTVTAIEPSSSSSKRSRGREANRESNVYNDANSGILNGSFESLRIHGTGRAAGGGGGGGSSTAGGHNGFSFADTDDVYPSRPRDTAGDPRGAIGTAYSYSQSNRDDQLDIDSVDDNYTVDQGMGLLSEAPEVLDEHSGAVTRLRCPLRTTILISASVDGTIRLWGAGDTRSRMVLDASAFSNSTSSSSAGVIATGGGGGKSAGGDTDLTAASTPGVRGVKILNVWAQETCETIWAACSDGGLRVWSGNDGKQLRLMRGHEDAVTVMEGLSSTSGVQVQSSCLVGTGSADRTVRVWDARAKKSQVYMFKGHNDSVLALRWGEGGRTLISAGKDKTIRIWDMRGGKLRATLEKHFGAVNALRCIPDLTGTGTGGTRAAGAGGFFVSAGRDSMINLWSESGDCVSTTMAHRGSVGVLSDVNYKWQYRPSTCGAPIILSAGADNLVKVWDLKKFKSVAEIPVGAASAVTRAVWADQGIVAASSGGAVRLWEYGYGQSNAATAGGAGGGYDAGSLTGAEGGSSDWRVRDLVTMSHPCTDLLSTDAFVACGSKSGHIYKWTL